MLSTTNPPKVLNRPGCKPIAPADRKVLKRNGGQVPFDLNRITRAVALAFYEVKNGTTKNPYRNDFLACFGLDPDDFVVVTKIAEKASVALELYYRQGRHPTIEDVQNTVVPAIAADGHWDVAAAYMAYRLKQAERRLAEYGDVGIQEYIEMSKYMRHDEKLGRRELWGEGVQRVANMHREFYRSRLDQRLPTELPAEITALAGPQAGVLKEMLCGKTLNEVIKDAFAAVDRKEVLPSMRTMQFGGIACLTKHARVYNCAFSNVDRLAFFRECLFLLLCGTGCGFSVQKHHIERLPSLPTRAPNEDLPTKHFEVPDTIEGWCDALDALINSYYDGQLVEFSYAKIRAKGTPLKTSGGKAPGHLALKKALNAIDTVLAGAVGRRLKSIEVYDIVMHAAGAVLSGGIRRSATICLFSRDDEDMMTAKTGEWWSKNPQRSASNNSAVIPRSLQDDSVYRKLFKSTREFGEPGFIFSDHPDAGVNPCAEIGLLPTADWELSDEEVRKLFEWGYTGELPGTSRLSGWAFCNLSSINGSKIKDLHSFIVASIRSSLIGTLQAGYTDIPYLGPITRLINEHDALIGVSICGIMASPDVLLNPEHLTQGANCVKAANWMLADFLGINRAARCTTVKPEGTTATLLGTSAGIHTFYAKHAFRNVQAARTEPIYQHFKAANPQMCSVSAYRPAYEDVITFPLTAPEGAILREHISAIEFLEYVRLVQRAWVIPGTNLQNNRAPRITHNVSNTCTVKPGDWDQVRDYVWTHRADFTGLSFIEDDGERKYAQAPFMTVKTEEDIARWNMLQPKKVDYTLLIESTDQTDLKGEIACAGGACLL